MHACVWTHSLDAKLSFLLPGIRSTSGVTTLQLPPLQAEHALQLRDALHLYALLKSCYLKLM